ncbi:hypothetical protein NKR23_g2634 [Pleurostoma richardsiae]|uniref:SprT-like domain-containing protein n=1 Tax=Pleurostoma richardsiae TaxID=41990 RepID=A0AA38VV51_9PEZI|nr:hypothetical protein NKR23_g2634 [Pleurostoma richardsiae]
MTVTKQTLKVKKKAKRPPGHKLRFLSLQPTSPRKPAALKQARKNERCPHVGIPGHRGSEFRWEFPLQFKTYRARDLLNHTAPLFRQEDAYLTADQLAARNSFVRLFLEHRSSVHPRGSVVREFMAYADRFFFLGSLTRDASLVDLQVGRRATGSDSYGTTTSDTSGDGRVRIYIRLNTASRGRDRRLIEVLGTLLHEMAHGYLRAFCCGCGACERDKANGRGLTGHGRIWASLWGLVGMTVRGWHPALSAFYLDRTHRGDLPVHHVNKESAKVAEMIRAEGTWTYNRARPDRSGFRISVGPDGRILICEPLILDGKAKFGRAFARFTSAKRAPLYESDRLPPLYGADQMSDLSADTDDDVLKADGDSDVAMSDVMI